MADAWYTQRCRHTQEIKRQRLHEQQPQSMLAMGEVGGALQGLVPESAHLEKEPVVVYELNRAPTMLA